MKVKAVAVLEKDMKGNFLRDIETYGRNGEYGSREDAAYTASWPRNAEDIVVDCTVEFKVRRGK